MRSLWQSITCIKNPTSPLNWIWVCKGGWDLSKEVLRVFVGQLASRLQAVNGSNLQHWQRVILTPVDLQRPSVPLWKDLNLLYILSLYEIDFKQSNHWGQQVSVKESNYYLSWSTDLLNLSRIEEESPSQTLTNNYSLQLLSRKFTKLISRQCTSRFIHM